MRRRFFVLTCISLIIGRAVSDAEMVRVAKRVGLVMTGFSLLVAPLSAVCCRGTVAGHSYFHGLLQYSDDCDCRLSGSSPDSVPAVAAKVVIVFHIVAYGTFQFVLKDLLPVHFSAPLRDPVCAGGRDDACHRSCGARDKRRPLPSDRPQKWT